MADRFGKNEAPSTYPHRLYGGVSRRIKLLPWEHLGAVAQLGEHLPCTQGVVGSNPIRSIPHHT